jgi:hypothetical protein
MDISGIDDLSEENQRVAIFIAESSGSSAAALIDTKKARLGKMKKVIVTGARLIQDRLCFKGRNSGYRPAMFTLTYREIDDWRKDHVSLFLNLARNYLARRGFKLRYCWVAELQKRGAVHYHVIIWLPRNVKLPMPDKCGWWPHGRTNSAFARKAVGYIAKYASKGVDEGTKFPRGIRLYGVGGLLGVDKIELRWWRAPGFARIFLGEGADIRKVKGGYVDRISNLFCKSPWHFWGFLGKRPFFLYFPIDNQLITG